MSDRDMGLPKTTENVSISVPTWLLEVIDRYCDENDFTRSKLISRAIRKYLILKMDNSSLWERLYRDSHEK
jgi:metal-responsive CopG/Arc/MetJ family transcriptional regulator